MFATTTNRKYHPFQMNYGLEGSLQLNQDLLILILFLSAAADCKKKENESENEEQKEKHDR